MSGLVPGRPFDMSFELKPHCGGEPLGKGMILARSGASIKRCRNHFSENRLFDSCQQCSTTLP